MSNVVLPYGVELRDYQKEAWNMFWLHNIKHFILLWHRRAGKSRFAMNLIAAASQVKVGAYYYIFPSHKQARRVIWEGRDGTTGFRFIDHFPHSLIKRINHTEMLIEFKNGSIFRLCGSDYGQYDALRGGNPLGILYDEYADQNPAARDALVPVLLENKGWELIITTPMGTNHFYDLYQGVKDNDAWYVDCKTIDDTYRNNGEPVVNKKEVEILTNGSWGEDRVQQELYCSFTAAVRGAIFGEELNTMKEEGRCRDFSFSNEGPINTYWDLGNRDATAIWIIQKRYDGYYVMAYYENNREHLSHYINWLWNFRDKHNFSYTKHFGPHDVTHKAGPRGDSWQSVARDLGLRFERVPCTPTKQEAINNARFLFGDCHFHATNCQAGLAALREYHMKYDETNQVLGKPVHNWASHGADAFLTFAQSAKVTDHSRVFIENTSMWDRWAQA